VLPALGQIPAMAPKHSVPTYQGVEKRCRDLQ